MNAIMDALGLSELSRMNKRQVTCAEIIDRFIPLLTNLSFLSIGFVSSA